ncbi:unnamed protein product [Pseudo-nitzschia multistriata]|uniref:Uncharacterized protein n=1 Tax=Pseudo-nitzschia multistriata TaxID=183589 RepID=A0A448YWU2_9STRA|nr:unnamed protein product [Pseudo-nitzschia multistriata]
MASKLFHCPRASSIHAGPGRDTEYHPTNANPNNFTAFEDDIYGFSFDDDSEEDEEDDGHCMLIDDSWTVTNFTNDADNACPLTDATQTTSLHPLSSPSSSLTYDEDTNIIPPASNQSWGIPRMTRNSQLRTKSYPGQDQRGAERSHKSKTKYKYHQVYSLPIVMSQLEWDHASMEERSFVLIFNSAVSNQLWGMNITSRVCRQDQQYLPTNTNPWDLFQASKTLYKLSLEYIQHNIRCVDKICIPAVFNNLSHLCKSLEGPASQEARCYDELLLKSVYWLIDSLPSTTINSNNNNSSGIYRDNFYDGDNDEIIDAFLENSFYLICESPTAVLAAAA